MPAILVRYAKPLAVCAFATILALDIVGTWLVAQTWSVPRGLVLNEPVASIGFMISNLSFGITGALLVWNRPGNVIGWLLLLGGLLAQDITFGRYLAFTILTEPEVSLASLQPIASLQGNWWIVSASALGCLLFLFPTGKSHSRAMTWLACSLPAIAVAVVLLTALKPGPLPEPFQQFENQLGVGALAWSGDAADSLIFLFGVICAIAVIDVFRRFRRSTGDERQQFKWFAYSTVWIPLSIITSFLVRDTSSILEPATPFLLTAVPVAIALAVFKYRLYDIDVLINRTLVYGLLTATLGGAYLILVVTTQAMLKPVSGGSDLAIAVTTLIVAALILPLRRHIQQLVDRHFNRHHYDAARTLDHFSARLREHIDLETLTAEMADVLGETMEPSRLSVWLRFRNDFRTP